MDAVGQLTGGVAHDFNNILTVITGTIGILEEAVADQPQLAAIAKLIDEAANPGHNLTKHLLAFARNQPLQPVELDVNALVLEAAKLLHPTLGENIEITPLLAEDAWTALADPNLLMTAVLNLAINARDAMPNGGKLALETSNVFLDEKLRDDRGQRHRLRNPAGVARTGIRTLFYHQGGRPGHRPWPQHGVRLRQAVGRTRQDLQRGRPRHLRQDLPAAGDRIAADRGGSAGLGGFRGRQRNGPRSRGQ